MQIRDTLLLKGFDPKDHGTLRDTVKILNSLEC